MCIINSLQEMLAERKDVDKFIFAVDTLFEKFLETENSKVSYTGDQEEYYNALEIADN